jgi:hypothetical protein
MPILKQDITGGQLNYSNAPALKSIIKLKTEPIIQSVKKVGFLDNKNLHI